MRKCGFHSQRVSDELKAAIHQVEPTLCVTLAHDGDFWTEIRQNTDTFLLGRLFEEGRPWRETDPAGWAEKCIAMEMPYHAWATWNEPDGINNEVTPEDAQRIDEWCCKFRERLLQDGYEAVGPNIATGNWHGDAIVKHMPEWCKTAKHISRHEYSARAMWDQAPALKRNPWEVSQNDGEERGWWYTLTYRAWADAIRVFCPDRNDFTFWITECGVAYGVIPGYTDIGWRTDMALQDYINSLWWYTERLNEDEYVGGAAIFQVGGNPDWESFETIQIWPVLLDFPVVPEPDPESEPEEPMDFKVYDREGNELTGQAAEDLVAYHGLSVSPPALQLGDRYFKLVALRDKTGDSAFIYRVRDEAGHLVVNPDENLDRGLPHRAWWWTDVQEANDIQTPYSTDRYRYADLGGLNVNGEGGSGMGAFHDPNTPGPYQAWVRHPTIKSDLLVGIGMIGSTNHDHMNAEWQETVYGNGDEPEPEPAGDLVYVEPYIESDTPTSMFGIAYPLDVSVDTRGSGTAPGVDDILHPEPWQHPVTGKDYAMTEMCVDFVGDESRKYTIQVYQMSDNKVLAEDSIMVSPLGTPRKRIVSIFEHKDSQDPENGDEPDAGEAMALLNEISANARRLKEILIEFDVQAEALADLI